jgi:hypothetical protein
MAPIPCWRCKEIHCMCPQLGDPFETLAEVDLTELVRFTPFHLFLVQYFTSTEVDSTKDGT